MAHARRRLNCTAKAARLTTGPGGRWAKDVYGRPEAGGAYSTDISDWGGRAWKAPPCVEKDQLAAQPFGALRVLDGSSLTHVRQNTSREAVFACRRACLSTSTTRCSASRRVLLSRSLLSPAAASTLPTPLNHTQSRGRESRRLVTRPGPPLWCSRSVILYYAGTTARTRAHHID